MKKIKWENIIIIIYTIITLFKYFISANPNILYLVFNLVIDACLGGLLHQTIKYTREELKNN